MWFSLLKSTNVPEEVWHAEVGAQWMQKDQLLRWLSAQTPLEPSNFYASRRKNLPSQLWLSEKKPAPRKHVHHNVEPIRKKNNKIKNDDQSTNNIRKLN